MAARFVKKPYKDDNTCIRMQQSTGLTGREVRWDKVCNTVSYVNNLRTCGFRWGLIYK